MNTGFGGYSSESGILEIPETWGFHQTHPTWLWASTVTVAIPGEYNVCLFHTVDCRVVFCPRAPCPNPLPPLPGKCCRRCPGTAAAFMQLHTHQNFQIAVNSLSNWSLRLQANCCTDSPPITCSVWHPNMCIRSWTGEASPPSR